MGNNDKYHTKRKKKVNIRMPTSKKPRGSTSVKITSHGPIKLFHDDNYKEKRNRNKNRSKDNSKRQYFRLYHSSEGPSDSPRSVNIVNNDSINNTPRNSLP